MRWLLVLAGSILLVLAAWLIIGGAFSGSSADLVTLEIPAQTDGKPALIRAAKQFLRIEARHLDFRRGCLLLRILVEGLDDADWPAVQPSAFRGWDALQAVEGSRDELDPIEEKLFARFARFGSVPDDQALIRGARANRYWKPGADQALLSAVSREITTAGAGMPPVRNILEAAVAERDYDRASTYVSRVTWAADVPETERAPVVRLELALRHMIEIRTGTTDMAQVVGEWSAAPEDRLFAPVLIALGIDLARQGQPTLDFSKLKEAMASSLKQEKADRYWQVVLGAYASGLPGTGAYMEAPVFEAITRSYTETFQKKDAEFAFWKTAAERASARKVGEGMWRVECLKHAFLAAPDDAQRLALLKEIANGYRIWMPGKAREAVEALAGQIKTPAVQPEIAKVLEGVRKSDADHKAALKKVERELAEAPNRTLADNLKRQLAQAKANGGTPVLIANLERQIKELERKLPE